MACLFILEPTFFVLNPDGLESFSPWTQKFFNSVSYNCVRIVEQKKVGPRKGRGGGGEVLKGLRSSRDQLNRHQEVDSPPTNNSEITETV